MVNHRRNKPKKQSSARMNMSSPIEVRDKSADEPEVSKEYHKKKKIKKKFGIESKWRRMFSWHGTKGWRVWRWYATEKQRDEALKTLIKNKSWLSIEFRTVESDKK